MLPYSLERVETIVRELKELLSYQREPNCPGRPRSVTYPALDLYPDPADFDTVRALPPSAWQRYGTGELWGGRDVSAWFRLAVEVPEDCAGWPLILCLYTDRDGWNARNPQFLAYVDGVARNGLDTNHREILLTQSARPGQRYEVLLHAWSGMDDARCQVYARLISVDRALERLYYDMDVPAQVARQLPADSMDRIEIVQRLNDAADLLDLRRPYEGGFGDSVRAAGELLRASLYGRTGATRQPMVTAVGHTHIDVAWLWRLCHTREKIKRSFATVLDLMDQYPEYIFMSSQAQLYAYLKQDLPELYEKIKERVRQGRWEVEGAMWLEADCNVTSGESLVRQLLHGIRFFEREFGVRCRTLWLPDVFGYSAALPQLLIGCGVDHFMTTKISWNQFNRIPCDTLWWEGIDGTRVLTHFITAETMENLSRGRFQTTYNSMLNATEVLGAWARYQQKDISDEILICYGYGDGGGGPTRQMLETSRRMEMGIPGCPVVKQGTAAGFFERLDAKVASAGEDVPVWVGELYLEYHRGTYTSIAKIKRANRLAEGLYRRAEWISSLAERAGRAYPLDELNAGWRTILLNQFHDILPGSSIWEVYEDAMAQFDEVLCRGQAVADGAMDALTAALALPEPAVVVFNSVCCDRQDVAAFDCDRPVAAVLDGEEALPVQKAHDGRYIFAPRHMPSLGWKAFPLGGAAPADNPITVTDGRMENAFYILEIDDAGAIASLWDKVNRRQVLKPGRRGNVLQAFEDKPMAHDAWDIDIYYRRKFWEIDDVTAVTVLESGPVRGRLRVEKRFLGSTLVQDIVLYSHTPRIDFETRVDWHEKQIMVKAAFPVDVHSGEATYEIQYGNVTRPAHWNTSWDMGRFEVCGQRWADLSEDGYGVSLMNDCKYGHDIKDGVMRLTLLKSAIHPNVHADRERHVFTYSLYPHGGGWRQADTAQLSYQLNEPMEARLCPATAGSLPAAYSLARVDAGNVMIEVAKKAEDGGELILRLYEFHNRRTDTTLTLGAPIQAAWECNLLEEDVAPLQVSGNTVALSLRPYEVKTLKLRL